MRLEPHHLAVTVDPREVGLSSLPQGLDPKGSACGTPRVQIQWWTRH